MSFPSSGLIMLAISLARILYEALHRDMGLSLSKELEFAYLGIKAKNVEFVMPPTLAFCWKDFIILKTNQL